MKSLDPKAILQVQIETIKTHVVPHALKEGQVVQPFALEDQHGSLVESQGLLERGPVVVVFYRGSWCPYCNLQLQDYHNHLAEFEKLGAQVVAIGHVPPKAYIEARNQADETVMGFDFPILFDEFGKVSAGFGLKYTMTEDMVDLYRGYGIDVGADQGTETWDLPVAATYVIGQDGTVCYRALSPDYRDRLRPEDLLNSWSSIIPSV